jgi:ribosomal protein S18 acetylase RimI-like enzyme
VSPNQEHGQVEATVSVADAAQESAGVRRASGSDVPMLARALARAFHDDPVFTWVLRGDRGRATMLERGFELFLRRVWMEHEETYTTPAIAGVAVWEPPGEWQLSAGRQMLLMPAMLGVFRRRLPGVVRALVKLEAGHPRELHYYLPFIGVDPVWQGRGVGGALLALVLRRCDEERVPAFLEASTARNRALYERHGFAVTEEFKLGGTAPLQWRMWREPA